jgi:hypothetical protein
MMPCSGLLPTNIEHAYEMGTSELHLNQHHVGSHRADHGPKHAPGVISKEGCGESRTAQKTTVIKSAAYSGGSGHPFRQHPATCSGLSGHL